MRIRFLVPILLVFVSVCAEARLRGTFSECNLDYGSKYSSSGTLILKSAAFNRVYQKGDLRITVAFKAGKGRDLSQRAVAIRFEKKSGKLTEKEVKAILLSEASGLVWKEVFAGEVTGSKSLKWNEKAVNLMLSVTGWERDDGCVAKLGPLSRSLTLYTAEAAAEKRNP